jgi:hypothetical protein
MPITVEELPPEIAYLALRIDGSEGERASVPKAIAETKDEAAS